MIVSGAVKVTTLDGKEHIIPVHRHGDAYRIMHEFGIERIRHMDKDGFIKWVPDPDDPFYTKNETFVDRVEAFKHAQECGQIDPNEPVREAYTEDFGEDKRKMKKIFIAILTIALLVTLCGCEHRPGSGSPGGTPHMCEDFIDPETGVHYLVVDYSMNHGFGLSPRYNSDGSLIIEKGE